MSISSIPTQKNIDCIAFCLPTYNEEINIEYVVSDIRKVYSGFLFVVDGFSTDKTVAIAEQLGVPVYKRESKGKGSAIQKALEVASQNSKEFLIYMDCDRTYSTADIVKMTENIHGFDLTIGVRPLFAIKQYYRKLGNLIATGLVNVAFNGKIKDPISGFKALRVSKFINLLTEEEAVIEAIICAYALQYNMSIKMFPTDYFERVGLSKESWVTGIKYLITFIKKIWQMKMHKGKSVDASALPKEFSSKEKF
jgi:glycosyltransferase involved in cell wall biosynthesis